jgi:hypothetical protein
MDTAILEAPLGLSRVSENRKTIRMTAGFQEVEDSPLDGGHLPLFLRAMFTGTIRPHLR